MKTTYTYDTYYDYQTLTDILTTFASKYPNIMTFSSIAQTNQGKSVWAVTLSDHTFKDSHLKPAIYIDANIHAGEVTGSMTALYIIDVLCTNYQHETSIQKILKDYTFYIIPMVSPDGVDAYLNEHEKLRSVNQNYPFENMEDGLHPQDLDGDGAIRMMRIKSTYGPWKISKHDSRIMTKRLPTDIEGDFYHIYPEGMIKNYDGLNIFLAPNKWGLDFNRNFPFGWFSEARQPGSGAYPLNQNETKALADFVLSHKNIGFVNSLHTTGGVFIYPPGTYSEKDASQSDMNLYYQLGKVIKQKTGYETKNVFDEFLIDTDNYSSGAFDDWCYETLGIPSFTIELWDLSLRAGVLYEDIRAKDKSDEKKEAAYEKTLTWIDDNLPSDTFKNWETFTHPQLGMVEIGGYDFKFIHQNPPPKFLYQEVSKVGSYLIESVYALPKLEIDSLSITQIEFGIYQLDIVIVNRGFMGTDLTENAQQQKTAQPIQVTLHTEVLNNDNVQTIERLGGFGSINTNYGYDAIETIGKNTQFKKISFLFKPKQANSIRLEISHPIAGTIQKDIIID